jgi:hypothetical protein
MKNTNTISNEVSEFRINVVPEVLSDLGQRLKNTRWSYKVEGTEWDRAPISISLGNSSPIGKICDSLPAYLRAIQIGFGFLPEIRPG